MTEIKALCLDGPLRGIVQQMPESGYVAIEYFDSLLAGDARAVQRYYRPERMLLFDRVIWIATCSGKKAPTKYLAAYLLSERGTELWMQSQDRRPVCRDCEMPETNCCCG